MDYIFTYMEMFVCVKETVKISYKKLSTIQEQKAIYVEKKKNIRRRKQLVFEYFLYLEDLIKEKF
jgi:hypothetical protein